MIFGNASWGFREESLEKQLEITSDMGLEVLELGIANAPNDIPLDIGNEEISEVKSLFEKYGIKLMCAATGNDFTNGNRDDIAKIKRVIDICSKMGIEYVRIFAGFSPSAKVCGKIWDNMIFCLNEVYKYAKEKNVTLTVETHGGVKSFDDGVEHFSSATTDKKSLLKMMNEVPDIKFNFDPANLWAVGIEKPESVYEILKEKICTVHLKDFANLPSGHLLPASCGESNMNWKNILEPMKNLNIPALFEYENTEDVKQGSKRCDNYIKKIIKEIER